jgi:tetratricopeptide (TPR) repeat protein
LEWSLASRNDVTLGQHLVGALWSVWPRNAPVEGTRWIALALNLADEGTTASVLARISLASGVIASVLDEGEIELASSERAVALYEKLGDQLRITLSQVQVGDALRRLGRSKEAEPMLLEALTQLRQQQPGKNLGYALRVMGQVCAANGDFIAARTHITEACAIYKAHGAAIVVATDLAEVELNAGNVELAFRHASDALPKRPPFDLIWSVADTLHIMSACLVSLEQYAEAERYAREALVRSNEVQSLTWVARALGRVAAIAALRPQSTSERRTEAYTGAARLFGFVDARLANFGSPRMPIDQREYERAVAILRGAMGSDKLASLMNEGAAMSEEQAVAEALADNI